MESNHSPFVHNVNGGPDLLVPESPVAVLIVDQNRVFYTKLLHVLLDIRRYALGLKLGRVDADHCDVPFAKVVEPAVVGVQVVLTIDAAKRPEMDDSHLTLAPS